MSVKCLVGELSCSRALWREYFILLVHSCEEGHVPCLAVDVHTTVSVQEYQSAILLAFIKLQFVFVYFKWPLKTCFTVSVSQI